MQITYQRSMEIRATVDLLVAGGGPSGIAAAVAAARAGCSVLLVEQSGALGGTSVLAMVPELMNFDDGAHFLSGGIGREVFDALGLQCRYQRDWYNIRSESIKRVYDRLVLDAGVQVLFYTRLVDLLVSDGRVQQAVLSGPEGLYAVEAAAYVDGTGSGSLCAMAGASFSYGDADGTAMPATICSLWGGVDFAEKNQSHDAAHLSQAFADGVLTQYDTCLPGIKACYPELGVGGGNIGHCFSVDDTSAESLTHAMFQGRQVLGEYERYYRGYVRGCTDAVLLQSANFIGIRESRRIDCLYTLSQDDFFAETPFPDEIGRYSYPIDIHPMTPDAEGMTQFFRDVSVKHDRGGSYSIPYRCLVPKGLQNVWVAGRCLGADRPMQASIRVIPGCYITGQAAGAAAAIAVQQRQCGEAVDVAALQQSLRGMGAYLTV